MRLPNRGYTGPTISRVPYTESAKILASALPTLSAIVSYLTPIVIARKGAKDLKKYQAVLMDSTDELISDFGQNTIIVAGRNQHQQ